MKRIFLTLALLISSTSSAAVLIQAASSNRDAFENFVKTNGAQPYSSYLIERAQSNPRQEEELFQIGEKIESSSPEILRRLKAAENSAALSTTSLNYIYDLSKKLSDRAEYKSNPELKVLTCKVHALLNMPLEKCAKVKVDFKAMERQWPFATGLMIESVSYPMSTTTLVEISGEANYQFTLLSDTHKAVSFRGTYFQFMQQSMQTELLVSGTCDEFSANIDDFNIMNSGQIFFNNDCVKPANAPQSSRSITEWVEANKSWVYPVGILVLGGIAYGLKDKTVVINKP